MYIQSTATSKNHCHPPTIIFGAPVRSGAGSHAGVTSGDPRTSSSKTSGHKWVACGTLRSVFMGQPPPQKKNSSATAIWIRNMMGKQWMSWYPTCKRNKIAQGETLFLHVFTDGLRPGVHQKTSQVPKESKKHVMWVEKRTGIRDNMVELHITWNYQETWWNDGPVCLICVNSMWVGFSGTQQRTWSTWKHLSYVRIVRPLEGRKNQGNPCESAPKDFIFIGGHPAVFPFELGD